MGLARGATIALLINATGIALGFASKVVLARILGPEQFGIYAYVLAWVTVLSLLATLGYGDAIMRFAPAYCVQERWGLLRGLVRYAEASILIVGLGIFVVGAAVVMLLASRLASGLWQTFLLGFAAIPIFALAQTRSCLARAFGRVFSALAPNTTVQRLTVIVVVPLFALGVHRDIGPPTAMVITLVGAFLALLLLTLAIRSAYPVSMRSAPIADDRALWRRTSLQLLLVAGTQQCMNQSDILLLGWLADTTSAGVYIVANQIAYVTILTLIAMNQLIGPTISTLYVKKDFNGLQKIVTLTSWWIFGLSLVLTAPIFVFSDVILRSMFGGRFVEGALALRLILIGQLVNCSFGSIVFLLTMTGHQSRATLVFGSMAVLSVGLNAALIPLYGLEGAAIAKALTLFGWNSIMAVIVYKNLQIVPGIYNAGHIKLLGRLKMARPHPRQTPDSVSGD